MKNIVIAGNIGKDAVTRTTQGGDAVTGWSMAVEERAGQDKRTLWFDCSMWGKRGEGLARYLTKGSKITVAGELSTREHEGKTYLTVRVGDVTLQGVGEQRGEQRGEPERKQSSGQSSGYGAGGSALDDGDLIPFMREDRA